MDSYKSVKIVKNIEISDKIWDMELECSDNPIPGQFYMLKSWKGTAPFLPRPIGVADSEQGKLRFLYEVRGVGTSLFSKLKKDDYISILGPLGNGFDLSKSGKIALVSGALGIAPLFFLAKNLNTEVELIAGFRDKVYFIDEFKKYASKVLIASETGSYGHKGYVTDIFYPKDYNYAYTCGPTAMMEKVVDICRDTTPCYVSMENRMACGFGACLGCSIKTTKGMLRVCKDGPTFLGEEVFFNDKG